MILETSIRQSLVAAVYTRHDERKQPWIPRGHETKSTLDQRLHQSRTRKLSLDLMALDLISSHVVSRTQQRSLLPCSASHHSPTALLCTSPAILHQCSATYPQGLPRPNIPKNQALASGPRSPSGLDASPAPRGVLHMTH